MTDAELSRYVDTASAMLELPAARAHRDEVVRYLRIAHAMSQLVESALSPRDPMAAPEPSAIPREAS